jgi:hypothetical protein
MASTLDQCAFEDGMVTYTRCTRLVVSDGKVYCERHAEFEPTECAKCGEETSEFQDREGTHECDPGDKKGCEYGECHNLAEASEENPSVNLSRRYCKDHAGPVTDEYAARYLNPEQVTAQLAEIEARENPDSRDQAEPTDPRVRALAAHLGCEIDEIDESRYQPDDNEATDFEAEGKEFRVLTDDEADEAASAYIKDSLWAFSPNFLVEHMGLPYDAVPMLRSFAEKECEGANDTFRAMVKDFDGLVRDAISSDGRGHFLGGYDFNFEENEAEIDGETFYIYRTN